MVARASEFSDIYLVDAASGAIVKKLTNNATPNGQVRAQRLVVLAAPRRRRHHRHLRATTAPRPASRTRCTSRCGRVRSPAGSRPGSGRSPTAYTGGDVSPVPLPGGGVVYSNYYLNEKSQIVSRIATVARPGATPGVPHRRRGRLRRAGGQPRRRQAGGDLHLGHADRQARGDPAGQGRRRALPQVLVQLMPVRLAGVVAGWQRPALPGARGRHRALPAVVARPRRHARRRQRPSR